MERQLIFLLNWDLKVTNEEMCQSLQSFWNQSKLILLNKKNSKNIFNKNQETKQMANAAVAVSISATTTPVTLSRSSTSTSTSSLVSSASSCSGVLQDLHQFPQIIYHQCIIATLTIIIIVKIHQVLFLLLVQIILQVVFIQ